MLKPYETVFILTPVLTEEQNKETLKKFTAILNDHKAKIIHEESWGLMKLAYPIKKKQTGYYHVIEFEATPDVVAKLELTYKRDERVLRFLTVALDKHAVLYNQRRRNGEISTKRETITV